MNVIKLLKSMFVGNRKIKNRGTIISKTCNCGKYKPISTKGVIDDRCRNCGGNQKEKIIR